MRLKNELAKISLEIAIKTQYEISYKNNENQPQNTKQINPHTTNNNKTNKTFDLKSMFRVCFRKYCGKELKKRFDEEVLLKYLR